MGVRRGAIVIAAVVASATVAGCGAAGSTGAATSSARPSTPARAASSTPRPTRLVDDATWEERGGVRALKVTPSRSLRDSADPATFDDAWQRVLKAVPDADKPGLKDQFVCHAMFASSKSSWYLEPARPAVGFFETVKARCNPGDVRDVG